MLAAPTTSMAKTVLTNGGRDDVIESCGNFTNESDLYNTDLYSGLCTITYLSLN